MCKCWYLLDFTYHILQIKVIFFPMQKSQNANDLKKI